MSNRDDARTLPSISFIGSCASTELMECLHASHVIFLLIRSVKGVPDDTVDATIAAPTVHELHQHIPQLLR